MKEKRFNLKRADAVRKIFCNGNIVQGLHGYITIHKADGTGTASFDVMYANFVVEPSVVGKEYAAYFDSEAFTLAFATEEEKNLCLNTLIEKCGITYEPIPFTLTTDELTEMQSKNFDPINAVTVKSLTDCTRETLEYKKTMGLKVRIDTSSKGGHRWCDCPTRRITFVVHPGIESVMWDHENNMLGFPTAKDMRNSLEQIGITVNGDLESWEKKMTYPVTTIIFAMLLLKAARIHRNLTTRFSELTSSNPDPRSWYYNS